MYGDPQRRQNGGYPPEGGRYRPDSTAPNTGTAFRNNNAPTPRAEQRGPVPPRGQSGSFRQMSGAQGTGRSMFDMSSGGKRLSGQRISASDAGQSGGMYNVSDAQKQRLLRMQEEARRRRQAGGGQNVPGTGIPRQEGMYAGHPAVSPEKGAQAASSAAPAPAYARVPSDPEGIRYGNHASYRTSDGRIIDGFDKKGRPIYRMTEDGDSGVVVRRAAFTQDNLRRLHPVRRIRVETLADTERKPFPWKVVVLVLFCTFLSMAVLYTYMELNECTNTMSTLTYRLGNLRNTYNTLSAELVQREDLIAIEETASTTLGMVKNDILTKRYVSIENEDKTELISKAQKEKKRRTSVEIDLTTGKPKNFSANNGETTEAEEDRTP